MTRDTKSSDDATPARRKLSLKRDANPAVKIEERLHKVLAQAGLGSRRALEERIASGQVKVNNDVAQVGCSIKTGDRVELDGKVFVASALNESPRVLIYNKPEGEVTTREDPEGRATVFENLPPIKGARWIAVGRLDINTTGLLLLTTDGDLANALMHPSMQVSREYICRIHGEVSDDQMQLLAKGVQLDDGPAKFDEIHRFDAPNQSGASHDWFRVVLHEGRNREVRRLWEALGFQVSRLKRISYGPVRLPSDVLRGQSRELPEGDIESLKTSLKLDAIAQVLTLQPVIGQRRAKASEYRPLPREQRAWTGGSTVDEGRELRAFDNLRDDRPARPGKGRPKPGGKPGGARYGAKAGGPPGRAAGGARAGGPPRARGAAGGPPRAGGSPYRQNVPDDIGNRVNGPAHGGRKNSGPGYENPAEYRSWYVPEGVTTVSKVSPPRHTEGRPVYNPRPNQPGNPNARPGGRPGGRPGAGGPGGAGGARGADGARPGGRPAGGQPGAARAGGGARYGGLGAGAGAGGRPGGPGIGAGGRPGGQGAGGRPSGQPGGPRGAQGPRGNSRGPGGPGGPGGGGGRPDGGGGARPGGNNRPRNSRPKGPDGNR